MDPTISAHKNEVSTTLSIQEIFQLYQFEYIQSILRSLDCGLHMPVLLRVGVWAPSVLIAGDDDFVASVLPAVRFAKLQNPGNITVVTDAVTSKLWGALHNPSYHPVTVATSMSSVFGK